MYLSVRQWWLILSVTLVMISILYTQIFASADLAESFVINSPVLYSSVHVIDSEKPAALITFPEEMPPIWYNISLQTVHLNIASNGMASMTSSTLGKAGATQITATYLLERKNPDGSWTFIKAWTGSSNNDRLHWTQNHFVARGYTYRLITTGRVTRNGIHETFSESITNSFF